MRDWKLPMNERQKILGRCRKCLRWGRRAVLALVFLLLIAIFYCNRVGVPAFVQNAVLNRLRDKGFDLHVARLRLRRTGLSANDVRFGQTNNQAALQLSARRVNIGLNYARLLLFQPQADWLELRGGSLKWLSAPTNQPARVLALTNIQSIVRLLPNDQWELDDFQAQFADARVYVSATISNASAIREWSLLHPEKPAPPGATQNRLRHFADTFEKIHFTTPPTLTFDVIGDARAPGSFAGVLALDAPDADTPWATLSHGRFFARVFAPGSNVTTRAQLHIAADAAITRWATAREFLVSVRIASTKDSQVVEGRLHTAARQIETRWATTTNADFSAQWLHSLTNPVPLSGTALLKSGRVRSRWGEASHVNFTAKLTPPETNAVPAVGDDWGFWSYFADCFLDFEGNFADVKTPKLNTDEIVCKGQWRPPELTIDHLYAKFESGEFLARAGLGVVSRKLSFGTESHFDLLKIEPILTEKARAWLSQFSWEQIPWLTMNGSLIMPAWTNRAPDWQAEVRPTVLLNGHFHVNDAAFREIPVRSAESDFTYSNMVWRLPNLRVTRPEGLLDLVHEGDDRTHDYFWQIHSTIDLHGLRPLFLTNQQHVFDLVTFDTPPVIDGQLWGRWHEHERIGAQLHVALTNFTFRGQSVGSAEAVLEYTNRVLKMISPRAERGDEHASADLVIIDWNRQKIYLTNGFSTANPQVIARMLGPKTAHTLEAYHFVEPPVGRVSGVIPIHDDGTQNLTFELDGGPFQWWKFTVPHVSGQIHWWGDQLTLNNIHAAFYDGAANGYAAFNFAAPEGADFNFDFSMTNANLHLLLQDLSARSNKLEGTIAGRLNVTQANTKDWSSWQGNGQAQLRDGLLWEIPIFGIFSPVFDAFVPGLGSSRFGNGAATYLITNSVIQTSDLELRSLYMRLQYHGTVDFSGNLDARVEAELLRDTWVIGRLVSLVLWPVTKVFEYQVTGTLGQPKMEPLYVPKFLLMPLHPIRTLKDLMPPNTENTNAPPAPPAP